MSRPDQSQEMELAEQVIALEGQKNLVQKAVNEINSMVEKILVTDIAEYANPKFS